MTTITKPLLLALSLLSLTSFAACAPDDAAATDSADASLADRSERSNSSAYFLARMDTRKCVAPLCGGLWVRRANFATTKCADGVNRTECYVPAASYDAVGLDEGEAAYFDGRLRSGLALVRGKLAAKSYGSFGNLGILKVTEAYDAWTDQAIEGTLHAVTPTGIFCISAPCPTLLASQLNRSIEQQITDLDLSKLNIAEETKGDVLNLAYTSQLLVAGEIVSTPVQSATAVVLGANQVFQRIEHKLDVTGDWSYKAGDKSRYHYTFNGDGTFRASTEPACLFAQPACAIKMALLEGSYTIADGSVHIVYTTVVRNGETADFVVTGVDASSMRLTGNDFGRQLKLRRDAE